VRLCRVRSCAFHAWCTAALAARGGRAAHNRVVRLCARLRLARCVAAWRGVRAARVAQSAATLQEQLRGVHAALLYTRRRREGSAAERQALLDHVQRMLGAALSAGHAEAACA
jgi:hypothetical protein